MTAVTIYPEYQIVIPGDVREFRGILSGQQMQVLTCQNCIERIPIKPMKNLKGVPKGMDTGLSRDKEHTERREFISQVMAGIKPDRLAI